MKNNLLLISWFLCCFVSVNSQSLIYPEDKTYFGGYVRASQYGFTEDFDYANTFVEGQLKADITRGFTEGYAFFKADIRARTGQFFGQDEDQLEIKDLYIGFRNQKFETTIGNQSITWGRGIGANPTNNLVSTNSYLLTANMNDQVVSNFMLRGVYSIHPHLDFEMVAVPMYKSSVEKVELLHIPGGVTPGTQTIPEKSLKNGSIAAKLNWNLGPMGASISYFSGYNSRPAVVPYDPLGENLANVASFKKQTIGGDFGIRIGGEPNSNLDPTSDLLILGEVGYEIVDNPDDLAWIPQSNLTYTLGFVKLIYDKYKMDKWTIVTSYIGKYVPNHIKPELTSDYTDPNFAEDLTLFLQRDLTQNLFGQLEPMTHTMFLSLNKSFDKGKYEVSLTGNYNFTVGTKLFTPNVSWNITKALKATGGGLYLDGPGTEVITPVINGAYFELKYTL